MKRLLILITVCLFTAGLVKAQEQQPDYSKIINEYVEMQISARRSIDSLHRVCQVLRHQLADSTKRINGLVKEGDKLRTQLESYRDEISQLNMKRAEVIKPYQDNIAALTDTIAYRDSIISSNTALIALLHDEGTKFQSEINMLQQKLDDLESFRIVYVKTKVEEEKPYLELSYCEMDIRHMNEVVALCEQLQGDELKELSELFADAIHRKTLFDSFVLCINNPYNQEEIEELLHHKSIMSDAGNEEQRKEAVDVINLVESYEKANAEFINIVAHLRRMFGQFREPGYDVNTAHEGVNFFLEDVEPKCTKFTNIPFLADLFEKYKEAVLSNPVEIPQIELEILNINM